MQKLPLTLSLLLICSLACGAHAQTVAVPGNANIFGAGHATPPGGGVLPPFVTISAGQNLLTFSTVTGVVIINVGSGSNANDPDGVGAAPTDSNTTSVGGISGIHAPHAGYLVGVFETSTEPIDPAPAILDFTTIGTNFSTLSPLMNQTFFIGDGLTGDGTGLQQQFMIPAGATFLYLGIADAGGFHGAPGSYGDNSGSFSATLAIVPEPSPWELMVIGVGSLLLAARSIRRRSLTKKAC